MPRYLAATRPGSQSLVYEIDRGVVDLVIERTGLQLGHGIEVDVDDGRLGLQSQDGAGWDLVVGDAFGGLAVPWHLATREAVRAVHRALTPDGVYMVNIIDSPHGAFVRAEVATIATSFSHVAVVAPRSAFLKSGTARANYVVIASDRALPITQLRDRLATRDSTLELVSDTDQVRNFLGGAKVLTDDFAPVDQILALGG